MYKRSGTTPSRLLMGVRVLFACFLAVGIWKVAYCLLNKSIPREKPVSFPTPNVQAQPLATPIPKPTPQPKDKNTLLARAVEQSDVESVKALLKKGANPNAVVKGSRDRLSEATWNGDLRIVKLLLRYGADVNPKCGGQSPLANASYSGPDALPMMRLLIRYGADVNAHFGNGTTVMTIAQFHSGDEAGALLKRHGAYR